MNTKLNLFLQSLIFGFFFFYFSFSNGQVNYYSNTETFLVKQLNSKRMVLLGDFSHGNALPYKSVVSLLSEWLNRAENKESKEKNIVLILEADDEIVDNLKSFINDGDVNGLVDYWSPYNTLETFEFFSDLRIFKLRVDKINFTKRINSKIKFDIFGAETSNLFNNKILLSKSEREGQKYFVNVRDSLSFQRINNYFKKNPSTKAIIFYGNAHLIKNYTAKNIANILPYDESKGYYLAYYLKKTFGENNVLVVNQMIVPDSFLANTPFKDVTTKSFFVYNKDIPWKGLQTNDYDGYIFWKEVLTPSMNISLIYSENVLKGCIKKMMFLEPSLPGFQAVEYFNRAKNSLKFLTGQNFENILDWKKWIDNNNYDGLTIIDSKEFESKIFGEYYKNSTNQETRLKLNMLGFGPGIQSPQLIRKTEWNNFWQKVLPIIKFKNSIGLYWIGSDKEKLKAKKYLIEFSGLDLKEPKEYLKYFRKKYYRVNY